MEHAPLINFMMMSGISFALSLFCIVYTVFLLLNNHSVYPKTTNRFLFIVCSISILYMIAKTLAIHILKLDISHDIMILVNFLECLYFLFLIAYISKEHFKGINEKRGVVKSTLEELKFFTIRKANITDEDNIIAYEKNSEMLESILRSPCVSRGHRILINSIYYFSIVLMIVMWISMLIFIF